MSIPGPASPLVLSLRGVSKSYGAVQALREVSFECRAGEVHALVGENGSGKSTLLGIASGFVHPDHGEIEIGGQLPPPRLSGGGPIARARDGVPDVLARARALRRREPLPRRARARRAAVVRADAGVGRGEARGVRPRPAGGGADAVAVARQPAVPRGDQGAARPAEGAAPGRADDGVRAGGRRAPARARARAEPCRGRHRLRQPPSARRCSASPTASPFSATGSARGRSTPPRCRRRAWSR